MEGGTGVVLGLGPWLVLGVALVALEEEKDDDEEGGEGYEVEVVEMVDFDWEE